MCIITVPPLFVIEFLHRVVDTFEDYFSECSENVVKDNYVVVYEVNYYVLFGLITFILILIHFFILFTSFWMRCWTMVSH